MPAIAAWPIVRPVSGAHKKLSVSAFSKLSSMLSRLRCARWSFGSNTVSSVILPESVSDACGTREIKVTSPSRTRSARREREARLLLQHVEHRLQRRRSVGRRSRGCLLRPNRSPGRARRRARAPCLRSAARRASPTTRRRGSARSADCGVARGRCGRCRGRCSDASHCCADGLGAPVVRPFRLARELALGCDVVAELGREHDVVAVPRGVAQDRLAGAVLAVDRRGVDEVDARVERGRDHRVGVVACDPTSRSRGSRFRSRPRRPRACWIRSGGSAWGDRIDLKLADHRRWVGERGTQTGHQANGCQAPTSRRCDQRASGDPGGFRNRWRDVVRQSGLGVT